MDWNNIIDWKQLKDQVPGGNILNVGQAHLLGQYKDMFYGLVIHSHYEFLDAVKQDTGVDLYMELDQANEFVFSSLAKCVQNIEVENNLQYHSYIIGTKIVLTTIDKEVTDLPVSPNGAEFWFYHMFRKVIKFISYLDPDLIPVAEQYALYMAKNFGKMLEGGKYPGLDVQHHPTGSSLFGCTLVMEISYDFFESFIGTPIGWGGVLKEIHKMYEEAKNRKFQKKPLLDSSMGAMAIPFSEKLNDYFSV